MHIYVLRKGIKLEGAIFYFYKKLIFNLIKGYFISVKLSYRSLTGFTHVYSPLRCKEIVRARFSGSSALQFGQYLRSSGIGCLGSLIRIVGEMIKGTTVKSQEC